MTEPQTGGEAKSSTPSDWLSEIWCEETGGEVSARRARSAPRESDWVRRQADWPDRWRVASGPRPWGEAQILRLNEYGSM